ncbi:MFS transporter [Brucella gallinifaecis]|uniref:MFS transporter n=1 Tax=Brucella gallinifaecis TaxID=215590 RepID=UPI00235EA77D|nr:MFS transporter [Brucella gallinifaecis]
MDSDQQQRRFLLYFAYLVSQFGNWAFRIGILIGLLQSSKSAVGLGVAVIFAPIILGSLFLSPLTDRADRLALMIGIDLIRAAAMIPLFFVGQINTVVTYSVITILSLSQPVFMSAQVSYLRSVASSEDMVTVIRNLSNVDWITYVTGMATGAFLIAHLSIKSILLLNAATFIVSALLLGTMRKANAAVVGHVSHDTSQLEPSSAIRTLYGYFFSIFMLNLGAGIINVYPAIRSTTEQTINQSTLSTIVIFNGIFGLMGALLVKPIYQRLGSDRTMTLSAGVIALLLFLMAPNGSIALATVSSSLMLGMGQIFAVSAQTHLISSVGKERAGKLSGLFQCCTFGGIALNGVLFSVMSGSYKFIVIVSLCALCAFIAFLANIFESMRQSIHPDYEQDRA